MLYSQFIQNYSLVSDAQLEFQKITPENIFFHNGKFYFLDEQRPLNLFTSDATYLRDGIPSELPQTHLFKIENYEDIVVIKRDSVNNIETIFIVNKRSGLAIETQHFYAGFLATIRPEDYVRNLTAIEEERVTGAERSNIFEKKNINEVDANRQQPCAEYRLLELAVAYDSSFCAMHSQGISSVADNDVSALIAMTSARYEQDMVCIRYEISHLEGYCDPESDPYKEFLDRDGKLCDDDLGLFYSFRNHWNVSKSNVHRDAAMLITGASFHCSGEKCAGGCASHSSTCDEAIAYSVIWADVTRSDVVRTTIIAHELGHNHGARHITDEKWFIMDPHAANASNGFHRKTQDAFHHYFQDANCFEWVPASPLTRAPTSTPTSVPTDTIWSSDRIIDEILKIGCYFLSIPFIILALAGIELGP